MFSEVLADTSREKGLVTIMHLDAAHVDAVRIKLGDVHTCFNSVVVKKKQQLSKKSVSISHLGRQR